MGLGAVCACASAGPAPADSPAGVLHTNGLRASDEPAADGARLFPESLDEAHGWGVEPGGGIRAIVAGVRIVSMAGGAMIVAPDRLPAMPSSVVALPDRLGGGFLFAVGTHLWASTAWLERAKPLFTSPMPIAQILVGLDRVYVRSPQGVLVALDTRTGVQVGLGPLPSAPTVSRLAAFDAWRAIAIADLRGILMTLDAGATWRPLVLPIDPSDVIALDDSIAVGGLDQGRQQQWWEVRSDGQTAKLASGPSPNFPPERAPPSIDPVARAFGPRPLAAAIEDGWPMGDGTALVARDGALARVRLTDGSVVEGVANAFPLKPARCHALSLTRSHDGALGFACGEPRGRTVVYRWDSGDARLVELKRFETPREVLGFRNGSLVVRGSCAADVTGDPASPDQPWCVMAWDGLWKETRAPRDDRLVVLSDGRIAVVHPPAAGELSTAHLTLTGAGQATDLAIKFPPLLADVTRALRLGVWMDGFEERRPGVVGGWVDSAGSIVGIEIAADGGARVGEFIVDAGAPVASGQWAFGWTASRRGFETTDGGMTWTKEIALPDPIASGRTLRERACGPVGCIAAGWLRVGWGPSRQALAADPPPHANPRVGAAPNLDLDCGSLSGFAPELAPAPMKPLARSASRSGVVRGPMTGMYGRSSRGGVSELPPFAGRAGPSMPVEYSGLSVEASMGLERGLHAVPLARIYAWGPKTGEWDQLGRWQVRWQWPWGGWPDARSSTVVGTRWTGSDAVRRALGVGPTTTAAWALAGSDDPDHALLLGRRTMGAPSVDVVLLETDRPPIEVHRPGGDPFPDVEGATRVSGHWYLATAQSPGELSATVVWSFDGPMAREVVRIPRAGFEARPALRLARSADGRSLGVVVDGQPDPSRGTTMRWVAPIDVDSNSVATPEPLAPIDLSDRAVSPCTGDDAGWEVSVPYPGTIRIHLGSRWESTLQSPLARMRLSHEHACVERVFGAVDGYASAPPSALARTSFPPGPWVREGVHAIDVSVFAARMRYGLRCTAR